MTLLELLPEYYQKSDEVTRLQSAFQHWITLLEEYKEDILLQLNVNTATWGLAYWEKQYGIVTDTTKPLTLRRERIKAKMSGIGTFNRKMVMNYLNTIEGGLAEIIEETAISTFIIKFNDYYRVPTTESINELREYTENIKPAHLAYYHTFTYKWWLYVNGTKAWSELNTWQNFRSYTEV